MTIDKQQLESMIERRRKPRMECDFPAVVRKYSVGSRQERIQGTAKLMNLSANGLYLQTPQCVEPGEELFVVARFSHIPDAQIQMTTLAIRGPVIRIEPQQDGLYGVAVAFDQHRFI